MIRKEYQLKNWKIRLKVDDILSSRKDSDQCMKYGWKKKMTCDIKCDTVTKIPTTITHTTNKATTIRTTTILIQSNYNQNHNEHIT